MIKVALVAQKGGDCKTTTAHALGAGLIKYHGKKVLYVDMDAQGSLSRTLEADRSGSSPTVLEILTGKVKAKDAIQHTAGGDIIAASPALAGADREEALTNDRKEYRLRKALEPLARSYDYCVIDTPPALGILTVNALTAADLVVIPAQADDYSLDAVERLSDTIQTVKLYCNPKLEISGILLTRYNGRTNVTSYLDELITDMAAQIGAKVYQSRIRECAYIKEAKFLRTDIYTHSPRCNAANDYRSFVNEFLEGGHGNG